MPIIKNSFSLTSDIFGGNYFLDDFGNCGVSTCVFKVTFIS